MSAHKWQFASRFRRNAFGWKSDAPIQRIKEALSEIRLVARKEPVLAAEGAIVLLEKLSPALMNVDSSSGALGSMVNRAIETLVPILTQADVDTATRQRWLDRLWEAVEEDGMPYIETWPTFGVSYVSNRNWPLPGPISSCQALSGSGARLNRDTATSRVLMPACLP